MGLNLHFQWWQILVLLAAVVVYVALAWRKR